MRFKAIIPASIIALAALAGSAEATQITGEIETINPKAHTITLWNGETLSLAKGLDMSQLKRNRDFDISYATEHGKNIVTAISEKPGEAPH